jgi:predicted DNA-binding protein (MmcQ/YjbR family)
MTRDALFAHCKSQFGSEPEYLWVRAPKAAALRHPSNRKWYAVVMDVPRSCLGLEGEGRVDIVNVKSDPVSIGSLRLRAGILPGYHMNKESWLSVLLDGTVDDETILALVTMSHALVSPRARKGSHSKGV